MKLLGGVNICGRILHCQCFVIVSKLVRIGVFRTVESALSIVSHYKPLFCLIKFKRENTVEDGEWRTVFNCWNESHNRNELWCNRNNTLWFVLLYENKIQYGFFHNIMVCCVLFLTFYFNSVLLPLLLNNSKQTRGSDCVFLSEWEYFSCRLVISLSINK